MNYNKVEKNIKNLIKEEDIYYIKFQKIFQKFSSEYLYLMQGYLDVLDLDEEFICGVSHFETLKQTLGYLKNTNLDYYQIFKKAYKNGDIKQYLNKRIEASCYCDKNARKVIDFPIYLILDDLFCLIHEFFHYLNLEEYCSYSRIYLTETISILSEFLLCDYLEQKNYPNKEYLKIKLLRFASCFYDANELYNFDGLIDIFIKNKKINEKNIKSFYDDNSMQDKVFAQCYSYQEEIPFFANKKYLLGIYLASDVHQRLIKNPEYINTIFYLIKNINKLDLSNCLKILNFDIKFNGNIFVMEQSCFDRILNNLRTELEDTYEKFKDVESGKSYSNCRTYSCR